ncbi:MAG: hypothetical protein ACYS1A_08525 [Planctomycetota bacterium]
MNLNPVMTKHYAQKSPLRQPAKQTQFKPNSNPIQTQSNPISLTILSADFRSTARLAVAANELQKNYN